MTSYAQIWEWIYENYDLDGYFSSEELLYDVENEFNRTKAYFPIEARDIVRERFQYRAQYAAMQATEDENQKIADFIGSGNVPQSLSDQMLEDIRRPEILGIDMSEFVTTKETIIPPDIIKFADRQRSVFGRFRSLFGRLFRR